MMLPQIASSVNAPVLKAEIEYYKKKRAYFDKYKELPEETVGAHYKKGLIVKLAQSLTRILNDIEREASEKNNVEVKRYFLEQCHAFREIIKELKTCLAGLADHPPALPEQFHILSILTFDDVAEQLQTLSNVIKFMEDKYNSELWLEISLQKTETFLRKHCTLL